MHSAAASGIRRTLSALMRITDNAEATSRQPFDQPSIMVPNLGSRRYGWTHYGVMIPDLPEPHRFFSAMSLIGATGSLAFDTDHALADQPRRNASVVVGTAASHPGISAPLPGRDFRSEPDGSLVQFGDELTIAGRYPRYRLTGRFGGVDADLELTNTDKVTWFVRNPVYKAPQPADRVPRQFLDGLGDHRRRRTVRLRIRRLPEPVPVALHPAARTQSAAGPVRVPDHQSGPDEQVLLSHHCIGGAPFITTALHRSRNSHGCSLGRAEFHVERYRAAPEETSYGRPMRLPAATRFTVRDAGGLVLEVNAEMDTAYTYGLGSGFVTGFRHHSVWRGETITGRGYQEYIDRRDGQAPPNGRSAEPGEGTTRLRRRRPRRSPRRRAPNHQGATAFTPAEVSTSRPSGEREERVRGRDALRTRPSPRSTASRAASTRLTWPCRRRRWWHRRPRRRSRSTSPRAAAAPGEREIGQRRLVRSLAGGEGPLAGSSPGALISSRSRINRAAADLPDLDAADGRFGRHQHPDVLLAGQDLHGALGISRRDDHLGEDVGDLLGHLAGDLGVGGDHAAEGARQVAGVRLAVRIGHRLARDRDPAGVGVFDDRYADLLVVECGAPGSVGVGEVVVTHLFSVQLLDLRQAGPPTSSL